MQLKRLNCEWIYFKEVKIVYRLILAMAFYYCMETYRLEQQRIRTKDIKDGKVKGEKTENHEFLGKLLLDLANFDKTLFYTSL